MRFFGGSVGSKQRCESSYNDGMKNREPLPTSTSQTIVPPNSCMDEDFWRQVERAKRMTPQERVREGLQLFDRALSLMAAGIRHQFPDATEEEVCQIRRERLAKVRSIEEIK